MCIMWHEQDFGATGRATPRPVLRPRQAQCSIATNDSPIKALAKYPDHHFKIDRRPRWQRLPAFGVDVPAIAQDPG